MNCFRLLLLLFSLYVYFLAGSRNTIGMNIVFCFFSFVNNLIFFLLESGGKKLNENKLLSGKNSRFVSIYLFN